MASLVHRRVGVVVASLRGASFSRLIAKALIARAPRGLECHFVEVRDLPAYSEPLDAVPPPSWVAFRRSVRELDALLVVTPDYHALMPDCLMNAIEVASHPEGSSVLRGLPAAVVSVSPYSLGGFGAHNALSEALRQQDMVVMRRPEGYVGKVASVMDETGKITHRKTDALLTRVMTTFGDWLEARARTAVPSEPAEAISGFYVDGIFSPREKTRPSRGRQATLFPHSS